MRRTPALIAGGGPAGAAAAIVLARAGVRPLVLERQREIGDALCGGFLSWRTLAALERLGIAGEALNPLPATELRVLTPRRQVRAPLPQAARAVSRRRLDTLLLARAEAAGAAVERGVAAREADGLTLRTADGATLTGEALLLATGKHDLRGLARPAIAGDPSIGLRLRLGPAPGLRRLVGAAIELHLLDRGYAGLVLQEDGSANCCVAIRRSRLIEAGGDPAALFDALSAEHPALGERLAFRVQERADAIANVPYGWRARATVPGLFRLGDQAGVIPSLAGEGMGIALASGVGAAQALLRDGPAAAPRWQAQFAGRLARPIRLARWLRDGAEWPGLCGWAMPFVVWSPLIQVIAHTTRMLHPALDAAAHPFRRSAAWNA